MTMRAAYVVSRKWRGTKFELIVRILDDDGNPESLHAQEVPGSAPLAYLPKLYLAMDMEEKVDWSQDGEAMEPWAEGLCKFIIPEEATEKFPSGGCDMVVTLHHQKFTSPPQPDPPPPEEWPVLRGRLGILGWNKD